ncbi:GumC family protein [Pontitalea aquivivens]|uniref:GumC family protein n=1 Tax=Pontitalea aquivivens TaxID=3388663 RepID=UPI0039709033
MKRVVPPRDLGPERPFHHGHGRLDPGRAGGIDLLYLFDILRGNLALVGLIAALCMAAMFIHLQRATPIYRAHAQILIDTRQERVSPVEEVVSNLNVSNSVVAGEVLSIRTNVLIGKVVDRLDLVNDPQFDPRLPRPESAVAWLKRVARGGEPFHQIAQRMPPEGLRAAVIDTIMKRLSVSQMGLSYVIGLSFDAPDPQVAARIANAVAGEYIRALLEKKQEATLRVNSWLSERILEMSQQVEIADSAVVDFRTRMVAEAGGGEDTTNQLLAELNSRLVATSAERADAEVRYAQMERLEAEAGLAAVADVVTSPLLETLQRQRSELAARQAELASTLGRRHPEMIRISAQIGDIDRSLEAEVRRQIEAMRSNVSVTRNREQALQAQIREVSDRADQIAQASVRLDQLERTAAATRLVYENFLSRFKETSAQGDFQSPEARIIGQASVPSVPAEPRKTLSMIVAAVAGLCLGVIVVFLRSALVVPVRTTDELRGATHLPILAVLPHVRRAGRRHGWLHRELAAEAPSVFMEGMRSIRTRLFDVPKSQRPRVILVTSALAGEGKSSICFALARALAGVGSNVALLDADLRRSDTVEALRLPSEGPCLIDYLEGKAGVTDMTERSDLLKADVVVPRRHTNGAADLIASGEMQGLITRLTARHDVVVINAPPVLHLADTLLLAKHADVTLMAVQSGRTPVKVLVRMLNRLNEAGVHVAGTVLTQVRRKDVAAREVYGYSYEY